MMSPADAESPIFLGGAVVSWVFFFKKHSIAAAPPFDIDLVLTGKAIRAHRCVKVIFGMIKMNTCWPLAEVLKSTVGPRQQRDPEISHCYRVLIY